MLGTLVFAAVPTFAETGPFRLHSSGPAETDQGGTLSPGSPGGQPGGPDRSTRETIWSSKGQPIESFPSAPGVPATVGRVLPGRPRPRQTLAHREPALTRLVGRKRRACGSVQGNPCRRQTRCERSLAPCFSPRARRVCALSPPRGR